MRPLRSLLALSSATLAAAAFAQTAPVGDAGAGVVGAAPDSPLRSAGQASDDAAPSGDPRVLRTGVRSALTVSNRASVDASGAARSGQSLEVSPFVLAQGRTPDRSWFVDYRMRNFVRWPGTDTDLARHNLRAQGDTALAGEGLRLSGRALVFDVNQSPFGVLSADPSASNLNRARSQYYELSPYLRSRVGERADYTVRYTASYQDYGSSPLTAVTQQGNFTGRIEPEAGRLGAVLRGGLLRTRYSNDAEYQRDDLQLGAVSRLGEASLVALTANYVHSPQIVVDGGTRNRGWGPGLLFEWVPTPRSDLAASVDRLYYGSVQSLRLRHTEGRMQFVLRADRALLDNSSTRLFVNDSSSLAALFRYRDDAARDPLLSAAGLGQGFLAPLAVGSVQSLMVWQRRVLASVALDGTSTSVSATVFSIDRRGLDGASTLDATASPGLRQQGVTLGVLQRLDPVRSVGATLQLSRNSDLATDLQTRVHIGQLSYNQRLSPRTDGALLLRRTHQSASTGPSVPDETAAIVILETRF